MKVKEIVSAYRILGDAKVNMLDESEISKIVKTRKMFRQIAEEFEAFLKDAFDKFKPDEFDETQEQLKRWSELSDEEKHKVTEKVKTYEQAVNSVLQDEYDREVDITVEKLSEESIVKLLKHNEWSLSKLDELTALL